MVLTIALRRARLLVDTDAKSIRRTIFGLEAAVIANDSNKAVEYLSKNSIIIRRLFIAYLKPNTIDQAKISNVKINEINKTTSPPRANVSLPEWLLEKGPTDTLYCSRKYYRRNETRTGRRLESYRQR